MKASIVIFTALVMSGCATVERAADASRDACRDHPTVCAIGAAVVVGSAAAIAASHGHGHVDTHKPGTATTMPVQCSSSPSLCT